MEILFNWCNESGVISTFRMIKGLLSIVRYAVPVALIIWTVIDLFRNVINPDDKDSRKKIFNRAIAALVVFLVPNLVGLVMNVVDIGRGASGQDYRVSECWRKA